ncbi:glyoxylate/hydroxypyruvate reductase HPR3-like [Diospyros lotus]|uniref:glyoxylate/hydroxypyruvate reductase HPR3-like n=1 Tax=Diospyros lotus TaxID=55363 RepID=UPI0022540AD9|nr:glyoxylate/hydroxypyruvate reductase HPR3-like [Diospyros lotus]
MASNGEHRHDPEEIAAAAATSDELPVVILNRLPQFDLSLFPSLKTRFRFLDPLDPSFSPSQAQSVRVLLCLGPSPVSSETLSRFPSLECVVGSSTGMDHVDLAECRRRGLRVTNAGDVFADDAADYAVALLIDVLRRVSAADRYVRAGDWPVKGEYPLGSKVGSKRVGIVGLGNIGFRIATRLEAFGCSIAYNSRTKKPHISYPYYDRVKDLSANSDALIICCALTDETHHMINKDVMTALGKEGVIVNVGRGSLIDEKELVRFLARGELGGAGLDVFEDEPVVPKELFELDNVVISPHRAVTTPEGLGALEETVAANIEAFFANKPLRAVMELQ